VRATKDAAHRLGAGWITSAAGGGGRLFPPLDAFATTVRKLQDDIVSIGAVHVVDGNPGRPGVFQCVLPDLAENVGTAKDCRRGS
jgi:hypothetical protein